MRLPEDGELLSSCVNTWLRDFYSDIYELCEDRDIDSDELLSRLEAAGYSYDKEHNRFVKA